VIGGDGFGSGDGGHGGGGDGGCGLPQVLATEVCHDERVHLPQQLRLLHRLVHCFVLDFSSLRFPTLRSPKAEACTVWEGFFFRKKNTSTDIPLGTAIHNIEITRERGGQLARAAGAVAKLIAKEGKLAHFKITIWGGPFGIPKLLSNNRASG
jgi:hypothetical protein